MIDFGKASGNLGVKNTKCPFSSYPRLSHASETGDAPEFPLCPPHLSMAPCIFSPTSLHYTKVLLPPPRGHQAFACVNLLLLPPESDLNSLGIAFEAPELPCRREGLIRAEQPLDRWEPVGARQFLVPETFPAQAGGTPSSWVTRFLPTNARRLTCLEHTPLDPSEATGK